MARHLAKLIFPRVLIGGVVTAALVAVFSLPGNAAHADGTFDGTTEYFFCNQLPDNFSGPAPLPGDPGCTGNFSPGANPDWGYTFTVPSGDYNFSTYADFMSDGFSIAADADIDDGTVVGGIRANVTIGLLGDTCSNTPYPDFILYDSTTNTANTVDALPEGEPNRFVNLKYDDIPDGAGPDDDFAGQADADSPAVVQYPSFLNTLLDPDLDYPGGPNGLLDPISPHARYTGLTKVGTDWVFLTILVFEKTQLASFTNDTNNATHPFARYGRNPDDAGWVSILVLLDPMQLVGSPSSISDFCSPLIADAMFLGSPGGTPRLTSPAADTGIDGEGTHLLMLYSMSLRDTDGDGLENSFDTCPFIANLDDPRATSGTDFDMIDPACDPTPNDATKYDPTNIEDDPGPGTESCLGGDGTADGDNLNDMQDPDCHDNDPSRDIDGDGFHNSQDNCPLASNVSQAQGEQTNTYIAAAPDGGFNHDSIGDACDSEGGGSDTVADGGFLHDMNTDAACIGGIDTTPADGFCDAGGESSSTIDTDGDSCPNENEVFMQTDPLVDCPLVSGSHDAWPPDMNNSRNVDLLDLVLGGFKAAFNTDMNDANYNRRVDLENSGSAPGGAKDINLLDLVLGGFKPAFNTSCTP
jgi:hypothetical protein